MATSTRVQPVQQRVGTVGAYMTGSDVELIRRVRATVGRVTISGPSALKALAVLERDDDLRQVDLDPACYLIRDAQPEALFGIDWLGRQRDLGLSVVRSAGTYVPRADESALRDAFAGRLPDGTVRVISMHASWLKPGGLARILAAIRACDDAIAIVLADAFDPLKGAGAIDALQDLLQTVTADNRHAELLRTDTTGIAFAAAGGALGAIGLSTSTRHHGLPFSVQTQKSYKDRQSSPLVFVPCLTSWQRGTTLGALTPFGGAGIADCGCVACDGRTLLRFDQTWPGQVPLDVRADARGHDIRSWLALSREVLAATDPLAAWLACCRDAMTAAASIEQQYKIVITVPKSVADWVS